MECCEVENLSQTKARTPGGTAGTRGKVMLLGVGALLVGQLLVLNLVRFLNPEEIGGWLDSALLALAGAAVLLLAPSLVAGLFRAGRRLSIEHLFTLSALGVIAHSLWVLVFSGGQQGELYLETLAVVLLIYHLSALLSERRRGALVDSLREALGEPQSVHRLSCCGKESRVPIGALKKGDALRVRAGETVPADALVTQGRALADRSFLTGESAFALLEEGSKVVAGDRLAEGTLDLRLTAEVESSYLARLEESFARRLERAKTPKLRRSLRVFFFGVAAATVATAVAGHWAGLSVGEVLTRSLAVLVVACPCGLGFAGPLFVAQTMARLESLGCMVAHPGRLGFLARARRAFVDKTGTLSSPGVVRLRFDDDRYSEETWHALVGVVERGVEHPMAAAIRQALIPGDPAEQARFTRHAFEWAPTRGVMAEVEDHQQQARFSFEMRVSQKGAVECRIDGKRVGQVEVSRVIDGPGKGLLEGLQKHGLEVIVLTGDRAGIEGAEALRQQVGLDPWEKAKMIGEAQKPALFIGDGVNDLPAMQAADFSIGIIGPAHQGLVRMASDATLARDGLSRFDAVMSVVRRGEKALQKTLGYTFGYNVLGIGLAALGLLDPVLAALFMMGSSFSVTVAAALWGERSGILGASVASETLVRSPMSA